ncbi:acyl-[acyl-carrier-protein] thioesterase [Dysgonomonas sp. 216]|uniref:acyl-[acyl-carrier-protein] thioesterase n=1 Tax=Dysgonomonas sp. 216 TaxID=2302934 RepID=UPI0013D60BAA|nr:acyl-ACP thioesterase domain-containing protein [Dysgonomonas sp. 216]NDW18223.1 acyl-[acyl-carrier-protein] thioesterase [Dysgonomonas sp. 216]
MLQKVGTYNFFIDAYLSDFRGKATLPMIGGFMLQAATKHAEERGFGYSAMASRSRVWVLSRMAIEIFEYPKNDTVLVLNTWVADVNKLFTERCFSFEDESGKEIGFARSIWASIDMETRRPTNVLELKGLIDYVNKEKVCPIEGLKKILPVKDIDPIDTFIVKYSDVDINKHLNSMKYIEHFVDLFDIDMFKEKEIQRFEINYVSEALYGSSIDLIKRADQDDSVFTLEMKFGETVVSSSRVTWK